MGGPHFRVTREHVRNRPRHWLLRAGHLSGHLEAVVPPPTPSLDRLPSGHKRGDQQEAGDKPADVCPDGDPSRTTTSE